MTNSDLYVLAMPLIAVAAVGLTGLLIAFQIRHAYPPRQKTPSPSVRGRLSEVETGLFRFQPDGDAPTTGTFKKIVKKEAETAGN